MSASGLTGLLGKLQRGGSEAAKFGVVGAVGWVVDTAVFNLCLHFAHLQSVRSGLISNTVVIGTNYIGNRYWTYRDRAKSGRSREAVSFVIFSGVGMVIQNGALALSHYGFGYTSTMADNVAKNVVGLALGAAFRFWAYRTWVFRGQAQDDVSFSAEERVPESASFGTTRASNT
ncbi:GtrA family protein [Streptomyces sp. NPDC046939]|uniref:GtrA family protein n=1 Tax=Streptomyces sp. NPDC046939 TaxID=3155376 RepID=UPI00340105DD